MSDPIVLYSIQTYLAYTINKEYYSNVHYVWCAPYFDSEALGRTDLKLAETSNPRSIYNSFLKDVHSNDYHYNRVNIESNINGISFGAEAKYKDGIISQEVRDEIKDLISYINEKRDYDFFRPLIYVIPYDKVKEKVFRVSYRKTASPFSHEYKIINLHTNDFDLIDLGKEVSI